MKNLLRSLRLIRNFTITLNCPRNYFLTALSKNVGSPGLEIFESLTSGPPFKGTVSTSGFKIRQRQQGFNTVRMMMVNMRGITREHDNETVIEIEANPFNWFFAIFYGFALFVYAMMIGGMLMSTNLDAVEIPFILLHAAFMLGLPYLFMRRSLTGVQRELEKEFYFLIKDYKD